MPDGFSVRDLASGQRLFRNDRTGEETKHIPTDLWEELKRRTEAGKSTRNLLQDVKVELSGKIAEGRAFFAKSSLPDPSSQDPSDPKAATSGAVWIPGETVPSCQRCKAQFTLVRRRHHCRNCGHCLCAACCGKFKVIPNPSARVGEQALATKPHRVCLDCFPDDTTTPMD